jgi:hypothetical protein
VAHSAVTDLTDADVLGLVWDRLQSRHVVQCALPENTAAESGVGPGIVAGFLAPDASAQATGCSATAIAATPYLPPKAIIVIVQHYGTSVFVFVAAAAVLMAIAMAALFVRMRVRAPAPAGPPRRPISARAGARIAGAAGAGMRRSEGLTTRAMRAGGSLVERGRSAVPRISPPRIRPPHRDSGALVLPVGALGFRARVRRFAYTHQDAVWVAALAAFITITVVIVLIAA